MHIHITIQENLSLLDMKMQGYSDMHAYPSIGYHAFIRTYIHTTANTMARVTYYNSERPLPIRSIYLYHMPSIVVLQPPPAEAQGGGARGMPLTGRRTNVWRCQV